ncbi:MAG: hypothetical protein JJU13_16925 [Balneolaceae bacterium]|nr:hypothetical protein [Balneolaceae bacterium]
MKSYFLFSLLILFSALPVIAQTTSEAVDELLLKAEMQMDELDESGALESYLEVLEIDPENYEALWNASLLHSTIGFRFDSENEQKAFFKRAMEYADKGLKYHPEKGDPYYVMAVAKGRMANLVRVRKRIELGHEIEEYVVKALDRMPEHAPSWHLYGVWQSEVANVTRAERMAARFISRGLPDASDEKAEEYLKKALEFDPESIITRLDLARHFERSGQNDRTKALLEELLELDLPVKTKDDPDHLEDAHKMLSDLR